MSINDQGHSLTLVKGHSDFKVKCLNFGLYTQVSDSGPLGPLVFSPRSHGGESHDTLYLYSDRTGLKIDHCFFNTK